MNDDPGNDNEPWIDENKRIITHYPALEPKPPKGLRSGFVPNTFLGPIDHGCGCGHLATLEYGGAFI
jgi:hypothetical protein